MDKWINVSSPLLAREVPVDEKRRARTDPEWDDDVHNKRGTLMLVLLLLELLLLLLKLNDGLLLLLVVSNVFIKY